MIPENDDPLIDSFGRKIDYVRISVTDRCDLRCRYCMAEDMTFLPRRDLMTIEEIVALGDILIARGVRRIRLTGGEPLVRKGIDTLIGWLGERLDRGLDELTLTTNGTQLDKHASMLAAAGVQRINVSLDTLDPQLFRHLTRRGDLSDVLRGLGAARSSGLAVKINMVALAGRNEKEIPDMLRWCAGMGFDLSLIETMPLGEVEEDRTANYLPLDMVRENLAKEFRLVPSFHRTSGPARYLDLPDLGIKLGLITPLSENFCAGCNRIRIAATGTVYGCLGRDQKVELREALREGGPETVNHLLDTLITGKPRAHDFRIGEAEPAVQRHMSVTGG
ncbi:GTP 3',8-cyclase MoaA [Qipengyuania sp. CAU 1752]